MRIHYTVRLDRPNLHVVGFEATVEAIPPGPFHVLFPEWIPGHYSIMNNARHVQDLRAYVGRRQVPAWKTDKQTWEVETGGASRVTIRYDFYAHHLSSGASFFDDTQCHLNVACFLYVQGHQDAACSLSVEARPRGWEVATGLRRDGPNRWSAPNYDDFVDCPVKVGRFLHETFRVAGKDHHVVLSELGDTAKRLPRLVKDTKACVQWFADVFGGLPYEDYWFLWDLHPTRCKGGALEHKNSTHLALPIRLDSEDEEDYQRIVAVACHEYFHLWNVKRIRPKPLGPFDYTKEQHTTDLWIAEGITDYYTWYALERCGIFTAKQYLTWVARYVDNLGDMPGRESMTVREASWDTWYQSFWNSRYAPEETNALNRYVDYYTKGSLVGAMLDVEMLAATNGRRGLHDVFVAMLESADEPEGYDAGAFEDEVERLAGKVVRNRLERWVGTTDPLPFKATFARAGLEFLSVDPTKDEDARKSRRKVVGTLGLEVEDERDFPRVRNAIPGGAAADAGLEKGDLLLAVDGRRLSKDEWRRMFRSVEVGRAFELTYFRHERLRTTAIVPKPSTRRIAKFRVAPKPTEAQARVRRAWLGPKVPAFTTDLDPTKP
jgi:predicted metalloprotease with PDZ domain